MAVTKDPSGANADTMTGIVTLPPEMIGNIMDKIVEGQRPDFRSTTTKYEPLGVSNLSPFIFASQRHYAIYKDREYTMMASLVERYSPSGPGVWELVVRLAALDKQCRAILPDNTFPEPMGQLFGVVEWKDLKGRIDELLEAGVKEILTPQIFKYVFEPHRWNVTVPPCLLRLPAVPNIDAYFLMQIPEGQRAPALRAFATAEFYNLAFAKRMNGSPSVTSDCPTALKVIDSLNESFERLYHNAKETRYPRFQCTWEEHELSKVWEYTLFNFTFSPVVVNTASADSDAEDNEGGGQASHHLNDNQEDEGDDINDHSNNEENLDSLFPDVDLMKSHLYTMVMKDLGMGRG